MSASEAAQFGWDIAGMVLGFLGFVAVILLALGILHGWLGGR